MENMFHIWKNGNGVRAALCVSKVDETAKAIKFKVLHIDKEYTFFVPKSALKEDTDAGVENMLTLANWFKPEEFIRFLFDRYASHYKA
jgi:hypothetical protein